MMKMQIPAMAQRCTTAPSAFGMSALGHLGTGIGASFGVTPANAGALMAGVELTQGFTGAVRPKATNGVVRTYAHSGTSAWRPPLS